MASFANAENRLIPDPVSYSDWFDQADERRRRTAVGSRRYAEVAGKVGEPSWHHFLDPETGELMPLATLRTEGSRARERRVNRVQKLLAQRREHIRQVQVYGFLAG